VHPIERLRYVARSRGAPAEVLVAESAAALVAFRGDPAGMVAACRRIVDRQLECGPLWWLCSRVLCGIDALEDARSAVEELDADPTTARLARAIDELGSDASVPYLVPVLAAGGGRALVDAEDAQAVPEAIDRGEQVWLVAGVGRVLPADTFAALERRRDQRGDPLDARFDVIDTAPVDAIVRPNGLVAPGRVDRRPDCPVAAELFRLAG
jgi:hypothetical protein